MSKEAKLDLNGKSYTLPTVVGTENERAVDISSLRASSGYITLDESLCQHRFLRQQNYFH